MLTWLSRSHCGVMCAVVWLLACSVDSRTLVLANAGSAGSAEFGELSGSGGSNFGSSGEGQNPSDGGELGAGEAPGSSEPSSDQSCVGAPQARRCMVVGGSFRLGPAEDSLPALVSTFQLDELEVTVGRFRKYVTSFSGAPGADAGAHPRVEHSGWRNEWNALLPDSKASLSASLHCNADWETWTDQPDEREDYPLTCASYYVAFAFCAWSGGRLPTEAEWEYAASGGAELRAYPWGNDAPSFERAVFGTSSIAPAGERRSGMARFGQLDMAGSAWEWTLDAYHPYPKSCSDCAELEKGFDRVLRGGAFLSDEDQLKASSRFHTDPQLALGEVGFRCASAPP